jgi:hypothetical protein
MKLSKSRKCGGGAMMMLLLSCASHAYLLLLLSAPPYFFYIYTLTHTQTDSPARPQRLLALFSASLSMYIEYYIGALNCLRPPSQATSSFCSASFLLHHIPLLIHTHTHKHTHSTHTPKNKLIKASMTSLGGSDPVRPKSMCVFVCTYT